MTSVMCYHNSNYWHGYYYLQRVIATMTVIFTELVIVKVMMSGIYFIILVYANSPIPNSNFT